MRGVAMVGALAELQKAGWLRGIRRFAGTSVGAVLAALAAIDADFEEVFQRHVLDFKFASSVDLGGLQQEFGLDTGEGLKQWIDLVLKEPLSFEELREKHGSTLLVCATNLNKRSSVIFGPDTHPTMDVAEALRLSCSVPLYFAAKRYKDGCLYVDGAITNNFPVEAAARQCGTSRVLGIRVRAMEKPPGSPWNLDGFLGALVESAMATEVSQCVDAAILDLELGTSTQPLNFKMPSKELQRLFEEGKRQGKRFVVSYTKKHH